MYKRSLVGSFKRLAQFTAKDYELLLELLSRFMRVVATPMILTEVNSLANALDSRHKAAFYRVFETIVFNLTEESKSSREIVATDSFKKIGYTDTSILLVAQQQYLVLTDDFMLSGFLAHHSIDALNFNHLRQYASLK